MTTDEFLSYLRSLNVELWSDGERLRCNAPQAILTPELWAELKDRKQEILAFLREAGATVSFRAPAFQPVPRSGDLPLSFAQQRLWFVDQFEENGALYNITKAVRIGGPVNVGALRETLETIIARHEVLRTTFAKSNGVAVQVIADHRPAELQMVNLSRVRAKAREAELQRLLNEEARRPFNLSADLMLRATLLKLAPEEHVLLLVMHHIASDGWSMGVLFREVLVLYDAFSKGRASPLTDLPIQYADYAVWQREWLQGEVLDAQLRYWKKQLAGIPELLEFPTDRPRPAVQSYHGAWESVSFSEAESEAIRSLSRREGTTLFMTLLTAFKGLLHRYTGQEDIVVGSPTAARNRVEIEGLIGFFVNTLVLRTDLSGDPSFRTLLGRVRETALGAYAHQDLPFEKLVEELQPKRALDHHPLFQVAFDLESGTSRDLKLAGLATSPIPIQDDIAKFDLTLFMADAGKELSATLEYNTDLFDRTTICRMLGHLQTLLRAILANPDERISQLKILPKEEKRQLAEWNNTRRDYPKERTIQEVFEDVAAHCPEHVALLSGKEQLTYRQLNGRANRLAHHLRKHGVGADTLAGICIERSLEMVVALLGILKAGGAYLPLDPEYPPERLSFMLEDAQVSVLVTEERFRSQFAGNDLRFVYVDSNAAAIADENPRSPINSTGPDSLAYVMYTSGSTGRPKGVEIRHCGVLRLLFGVDYVELGRDKSILQMAPISFDASTFEIWGALLHGGRCVIFPDRVPTVATLGTALRRHGITTLWLTSSLYNVVIEDAPNILSGVKQLLIGGEALSLKHVRRGLSLLPFTQIINGYGPTESTTFTCCYPIPRSLDDLLRSVPIGKPIGNTEVYLVDRHLQPVPVGVVGELLIGGAGLARGYLNRPKLTAEKFIPNPFAADPGARLYKTGDLARSLPDGNIEFIGRMDGQVKIRGFRLEPEEIETVLKTHPAVGQAIVLATETIPGEKRLIAYVVSAPESGPTAMELDAFLRKKLPAYMVPATFVFLGSLPLTPNGKIDRRGLPPPSPEDRNKLPAVTPPRNEIERQLVQIWEEELAVRPISVRDNFFDLGGHSLLAVRVFARMEQGLGVRLPLAELFRTPTIEGLAETIRSGARSSSWRSLVPIKVGGSQPPLFAVPGVGGNVLCYADLARLMAPEQPFYGLQSRGLNGMEKPLTRVEDIAAEFLKEIRDVQPVGPYYLIGACMGGVVAYEMAQQLRDAEQEVGPLILLETWLPDATSGQWVRASVRTLAALQLITSRLRLYVDMFKRLRGRQRLNYLLERMKMLVHAVTRHDPFRGDPSEFYLQIVTQANLIALQRYRPRAYPGRVVLFRAEGREVPCADDRRLAWSRLSPNGLEVISVPGNDSGLMLMEPHVRVWSKASRHVSNAPSSVSL